MEDLKNEEKKECCGENKCCDDKKSCCDDKKSCCDDKKACFSVCKHCPCAHKIVKLILAIILVCALLRIGAEFGERRAERSDYGRFEGRGMMMGLRAERADFIVNEKQGGCRMMQQGDFKQGGCQALNNNGGDQGGCPMLEAQKASPATPTTTVK